MSILAASMQRARAIEGLGWVDAASRRFVLPRTSSSNASPPESALPFELVEREDGPMAIVRGSVLDADHRAGVRACLANVVTEVAFLLAGEKGAYLGDPETNVVACVDALSALRGEARLDEPLVVRGVSRAAYLDSSLEQPIELHRHRGPLELAYAGASSAAVIRADVDRLMVYNDWLGFLEGDLLLARVIGMACEVVQRPRAPRSPYVSLARRELVVIASGIEPAQALGLAEDLVEGMRRMRVQLRHPEARHVPYMTLSAGAVWVADTTTTPLDRALDEADAAVQSAKLAGRDRASMTRIET